MKFDHIIKSKFNDEIDIEYGIIDGNDTVVLIESGTRWFYLWI